MSFIKDLVKSSGNEYASVVSDGVSAGDVDSFVDTGSYVFNALLSGSLYGGLPTNKITAIAGESATGKTYFALGMVRQFLEDNKDAAVIFFESESAMMFQVVSQKIIALSWVTSTLILSLGINKSKYLSVNYCE